jgi:hypothetical protein
MKSTTTRLNDFTTHLEQKLSRIDLQHARAHLTVHVVHRRPADSRDVDGELQRANGARVAVGQQVLHVCGGGVDEDAALVPGARLDARVL